MLGSEAVLQVAAKNSLAAGVFRREGLDAQATAEEKAPEAPSPRPMITNAGAVDQSQTDALAR